MSDKSRVQGLLHHPATAWVILLASFAITGFAWHLSDSYMRERARDRFEQRVANIQVSIERRMVEYEATLRGGLGLFNSSEFVSRQEWRTYADSLQLDRYFPGIQGFGFTQVVPASELERHQARLRAEGFHDYAIRPPGSRDPYTAIIYLEPFNVRNRRAFGYDMFSEEVRRVAMERARDTGQPALSGRVRLVQETEADIQHGVLLYLPVYRSGATLAGVAERQSALVGYVYAPFRMRDLMQGILGADTGDVDFWLFDGPLATPETELFRSAELADPASHLSADREFAASRSLTIAGRTWSLHVAARPAYISGVEAAQPLIVAIGGLTIDLLLFVIIGSIARRRREAEEVARAMTESLRRSNAELEQFAYAASHDMRQPLRMVASYMQLLEGELGSLLDPRQRQYFRFAVDGARRMDEMLVSLLEYSRVGRTAMPISEVDTRAALEDAMHIMHPTIRETGADVRVLGDWPKVRGIRDDFVRLFQNLIDNALKYRLSEGMPQIVIEAIAEPGCHRFEVRDNGIGLESGQEARLFKVFERLQPRDRYPGAGIGLALCRKIVESHGGMIGVRSPGSGLGCTFYFTLPDTADGEGR